jgi:DNA-binding NarL/FixJ family response regulator
MAIRVLIVERHAVTAEALRSALLDAKMDVAAVFSTGQDAIAFLERDQPDVILMDLELPDSRIDFMERRLSDDNNGLALGDRILKRWPDAKMILLSPWDHFRVIDGALRGGFRGYLSKATPMAKLVTAVQTVADGEAVFPKLSPEDAPEDYPDPSRLPPPLSDLTEQEKTAFELVVEGADSRTVAQRLGISRIEAGSLVKAILRQLNVEGRFDD